MEVHNKYVEYTVLCSPNCKKIRVAMAIYSNTVIPRNAKLLFIGVFVLYENEYLSMI